MLVDRRPISPNVSQLVFDHPARPRHAEAVGNMQGLAAVGDARARRRALHEPLLEHTVL